MRGRTGELTTAQEQTKSGLQCSWQVSRGPLMLIQTPYLQASQGPKCAQEHNRKGCQDRP
ncbi:Uncharacterized protein FKW44_017294 [Caligus rogercresseyi]|uniref:Uncharacterized protein n=1 Tax=Caligus rogercresseyi TaxID=217165 RepID=A0A7T8GSU1_CALRO|nr:Uncharacterized protein FKW44_017294 [Caligus rogercresseyi]